MPDQKAEGNNTLKDQKRRRRGQNEGSIFKRKDGRWCAVVNLGWQNGKLKRKYFYGDTRAEVQQALTKALRDREQGLPVAVERQTVAQFLDRWLNDHAKPKVRPKTFRSYEGCVRLHLKPKLGRVILEKLTPQQVQTMMTELTAEVSANTARYARTVLRIALGQALKWGLVARNVATLTDPPTHRKLTISPLTPEEARQFLDAIAGDRLEALFSVALAMGLRQAEALALRWQDVDWQARTLKIENQLQRVEKFGRLRLVPLKSESSRRLLAMPETIVAALRAHRTRQLEEKMLAGEKWEETGLVFTTTVGTAMDARNVLRKFHAAREKAGLRYQRYHDLRHASASLLLAQNVPVKTIQELLGHSDIRLTLNTYSHVLPAMKREAADLMDAILSR